MFMKPRKPLSKLIAVILSITMVLGVMPITLGADAEVLHITYVPHTYTRQANTDEIIGFEPFTYNIVQQAVSQDTGVWEPDLSLASPTEITLENYTAYVPIDITDDFVCPNFLAAVRGITGRWTGFIYNTDVADIAQLWINDRGITSLAGIEHFTALTQLFVGDNQLAMLDVSNNAALTFLQVGGNQLTELDVSYNTALTGLRVYYNFMTMPDDVIGWRDIGLVLGSGFIFWPQRVLYPINITDDFACANFLNAVRVILDKPTGPIYNTDVAVITSLTVSSRGITSLAGIEHFMSLKGLNAEWNQLTKLDVSNNMALESLRVNGNNLTELDVSNNVMLTILEASWNQLTELDVSNNKALFTLWASGNYLTELDVSNNRALRVLEVNSNQLTELDVSTNMALTRLWSANNRLTELDVSYNTALRELSIGINQLTRLDVSNNEALTQLWSDNNQLTELDVSHNTALVQLLVYDNRLSVLNISNNTALTRLNVRDNIIAEPDDVTGWQGIFNRVEPESSDTWRNGFHFWPQRKPHSIDITDDFACQNFITIVRSIIGKPVGTIHNTDVAGITDLQIFGRNISSLSGIEHFTALTILDVRNNQLTELDVSNNKALFRLLVSDNYLTELDVTVNTALTSLGVQNNLMLSTNDVIGWRDIIGLVLGSTFTFWPQIILHPVDITDSFECSAFLEHVRIITGIPTNSIYDDDVARIIVLNIGNLNITSLAGIEHFTALLSLGAWGNRLTELDVSNNTSLTSLRISNNQLTELDVSNNMALTWIDASNNQLTELDVSNNTALTRLTVNNNQLTELDVSANTALTELTVNNNQLTELDVSNNEVLTSLWSFNNQLTELDVSANTALTRLSVEINQLTCLDVSNNETLTELTVNNNQLTELDVSANTALTQLTVNNNQLTELDVSANTALLYLDVRRNFLTENDDVIGWRYISIFLFLPQRTPTSIDITNDFSCPNFLTRVRQVAGLPSGSIYDTDVAGITWLNADGRDITSLAGIEHFTALTSLTVRNNHLYELDVSNKTALTALDVRDNIMTMPDDVIGWQEVGLVLGSTFHFNPQRNSVREVTVLPDIAHISPGDSVQFIADVTVSGSASTVVTWSVIGNNALGTIINADGLLTADENETAENLIVRATSTFDTSVYGTAAVILVDSGIDITVTSPPTANIAPGRVLSGTLVMLTTQTPGARIYYTLDGTDPLYSDTRRLFTDSFIINGLIRINARAFMEDMIPSRLMSFVYDIIPTVAAPTASLSSGTVPAGTRIVLFTTTPGATIRFTIDGSVPTESSPIFTAPILLNEPITIRAQAFRDGWIESGVSEFVYNIQAPQPQIVVGAGTVMYGSTAAITAIRGTTIRYTTDGSEPTASSQIYSMPIRITGPVTIRARAFRDGWVSSETASHTISNVQALAPIANPQSSPSGLIVASGTTVTLSTAMYGDYRIHYTINDSAPTISSPLYTEPIPISDIGTTTIRAIAVRDDLSVSAVATFIYSVQPLRPIANPSHGTLVPSSRITLSAPGATIRYTINGPNPTADSGNIYTEPIQLNNIGIATIRAVAVVDGVASEVATFMYTVAARAATPTANRPNGTALNLRQANGNRIILTSTPGATIWWTNDGTEPIVGHSSIPGRRGFISSGGFVEVNFPQTIRAIASAPNRSPSLEARQGEGFTYTIGVLETIYLTIDVMRGIIPNIPVSDVANSYYVIDFGYIPATVFHTRDQMKLIIGHAHNRIDRAPDGSIRGLVGPWRSLPGNNHELRIGDFRRLRNDVGVNRWITNPNAVDAVRTGVIHHEIQGSTNMFLNPRLARNSRESWIVGYAVSCITNPEVMSGRISLSYAVVGNATTNAHWLTRALNAILGEINPIPGVGLAMDIAGLDFITHTGDTTRVDNLFYQGTISVNNRHIVLEQKGNLDISSHFHHDSRMHIGLGPYHHRLRRTVNLRSNAINTSSFSGDYNVNDWRMVLLVPLPTSRRNGTFSLNTINMAAHGFLSYNDTLPHAAHNMQWGQTFITAGTEPLITETNSHRIMAFIAEGDSRDEFNNAILMYSLYDNSSSTWNDPLPVHDDETADFFPSITSDGTNIWVSWHNSNRLFNNDDTIDDIFTVSEIVVARFDGASNTFTDVTVLTDNDIIDTYPRISVSDDEVFVAWVQNADNDIFGTESFVSSIVARHFVNGDWSDPITISSGHNMIIDMDTAHFNGMFHVAYVTNTDNDPKSNNLNLTLRNLNGTTVAIPVAGSLVLNPRFTTINSTHVLSWKEEVILSEYYDGEVYTWEGGNIRYMTADGQIRNLFETQDFTMTNYRIVNNSARNTAVLWSRSVGDNGLIIARTQHNGSWSNPFVLAEAEGFIPFFDVIWEDCGEFNLVFTSSRLEILGEGNNEILVETNNINKLRTAPAVNVRLSNILYFLDDVVLGGNLPVQADIFNNGGVTVNSVIVRVNGTVIGTFPIGGGLPTGEFASIEFELDIPSNMTTQTEFVISIEPVAQTDVDMSDNARTITLGHVNLSLRVATQHHEDDTVTVFAYVQNTGDFSASAILLVRQDAADGDVINFADLGAIGERDYVVESLNFDPRTLVPEGEDFEILFFEVVSDVEELFMSDNTDFIAIHAPIPHIPHRHVVWWIDDYDTQNGITATAEVYSPQNWSEGIEAGELVIVRVEFDGTADDAGEFTVIIATVTDLAISPVIPGTNVFGYDDVPGYVDFHFYMPDTDVGLSLEFVFDDLENILWGDVLKDGYVNLHDVSLLLEYLAGHDVDINRTAADVLYDGEIDIHDVSRLLEYLAGHDVTLGPEN